VQRSARAAVSTNDSLNFRAPERAPTSSEVRPERYRTFSRRLRGRVAAINRPTVARKLMHQERNPNTKTPHHHALEPRAGGSIKRDDPGAKCQPGVGWLFRRQFRSEPPVQFEREPKPRIRRPQQPRSGGVIVRAVPHIDVEICTVVAVLHAWQRRPVAAQAIRPITGAGLVTHFEAFWVWNEN
jgi:hypothetical protein